MTKVEYVREMLVETLGDYQISPEHLTEAAESIVHGLDVWHEMSSDRVADTNWHGMKEGEKKVAVDAVRKEMEQEEKRHQDEKEGWRRYASRLEGVITEKNSELEKLRQ